MWCSQVHRLLELVRQEQNIYTICFHEIIRQVQALAGLIRATPPQVVCVCVCEGECAVCGERGTAAGDPQQVLSAVGSHPATSHEVPPLTLHSANLPTLCVCVCMCVCVCGSLHEDVLSQRALCKRLSAEFRQFKSKIASITE